MITAIVNFQLPSDMTSEKAAAAFQASAPNYQNLQGLVRKYYLYDDDRKVGGGVYLWKSREAAEAVYTDEWKASIKERFGVEPSIAYFESPVIVDNTTGAIDVAAE